MLCRFATVANLQAGRFSGLTTCGSMAGSRHKVENVQGAVCGQIRYKLLTPSYLLFYPDVTLGYLFYHRA